MATSHAAPSVAEVRFSSSKMCFIEAEMMPEVEGQQVEVSSVVWLSGSASFLSTGADLAAHPCPALCRFCLSARGEDGRRSGSEFDIRRWNAVWRGKRRRSELLLSPAPVGPKAKQVAFSPFRGRASRGLTSAAKMERCDATSV